MARVDLDTIWLSSRDDPADVLEMASASTLDRMRDTGQRVEVYASGRFAAEPGDPVPTSWSIGANLIPVAEMAWLERHIGKVLCVRDHRGKKIYGIVTQLPESVLTADDWSTMSMTVTEITVSEAV